MKREILVVLLMVSCLSILSAQNNKVKINPIGSWKFDAPYAPEGYNSGIIVVGLTEKKQTATMSFAGSEYKLAGEKVQSVNDSILFSIYLEGQDIKVLLKLENETKMTGKAVYTEGEVPLTLNKIVEPVQK
jgi:hypothetical protein